MDVIVPGMRINPLLQGEEATQRYCRSYEDGWMHEERLVRILFPLFKGQVRILDFLSFVYDRSPQLMGPLCPAVVS